MWVEVTAMKNFPSNLGSRLARARFSARISRESPVLMISPIIHSSHYADWPFSDIKSPWNLGPKPASTGLVLGVLSRQNRGTVGSREGLSWLPRPAPFTRRMTMTWRSPRIIGAACILAALALPMDLAAQSYDVTILQGLGGGAGANS